MFTTSQNTLKHASFQIKMAGTDLAKDAPVYVDRVEFEEEINTISAFVVSVKASKSDPEGRKYLEMKGLKLGQEAELSIGMEKPVCMMNGEVVALEGHFSPDMCRMDITVYDRLHRLRFGRKVRTFMKIKDSAIASAIAADWGLTSPSSKPENKNFKIDQTSTVYPHIFQNNQSDFDFLMERASLIRYEVGVKEKSLYFRKSQEDSSADLTLTYPMDLHDFSARLSARHEGSKFEVRAWDIAQKKAIKGMASAGKEVSMGVKKTGTKMTDEGFSVKPVSAIVDKPVIDPDHASAMAEASFNLEVVESVVGEGICDGNEKLRAGNNIEIKGIGKFEGVYYVTYTKHTILDGVYTTEFKVRRTGI